MKLCAELSASTTSFFREIKQKITLRAGQKRFFKRFFAFTALAALFGGFFCLIFLTSIDSLKNAKNSKIAILSNFGASTSGVFAKKALAKAKITEPSCETALPLASMVNPSITIFKMEELCTFLKIEESSSSQEIELAKKEPSREELEKKNLERQLMEILQGTPMEEMIEFIADQPRIVAAYLVGIALKESSLGEHSPTKNGANCYNYWGYKGATNPTAGGYSCFSSAQEAVETVGGRLQKLAIEQKRDAPAKMVVWKCGSSCATHSPQSVSKWISDVSKYYYEINPKQEIAKVD